VLRARASIATARRPDIADNTLSRPILQALLQSSCVVVAGVARQQPFTTVRAVRTQVDDEPVVIDVFHLGNPPYFFKMGGAGRANARRAYHRTRRAATRKVPGESVTNCRLRESPLRPTMTSFLAHFNFCRLGAPACYEEKAL